MTRTARERNENGLFRRILEEVLLLKRDQISLVTIRHVVIRNLTDITIGDSRILHMKWKYMNATSARTRKPVIIEYQYPRPTHTQRLSSWAFTSSSSALAARYFSVISSSFLSSSSRSRSKEVTLRSKCSDLTSTWRSLNKLATRSRAKYTFQ